MMNFEGMKGKYRTVSGRDLEFLTAQGWHFVFSYQETAHFECAEVEPAPAGLQNNYNGTICVKRFKPNTITYFVVHRDEESVLAESHAALAQAQRMLHDEQQAHREAAEELKKVKAQLTHAESNSKIEAGRLTDTQNERDRSRRTAVKLETDLAKIRKAIGERAFNEILPPEPKKEVTSL